MWITLYGYATPKWISYFFTMFFFFFNFQEVRTQTQLTQRHFYLCQGNYFVRRVLTWTSVSEVRDSSMMLNRSTRWWRCRNQIGSENKKQFACWNKGWKVLTLQQCFLIRSTRETQEQINTPAPCLEELELVAKGINSWFGHILNDSSP